MSDPDIYRRLAALERWRDERAGDEVPGVPSACRYSTAAGQSIPNSALTIVNYGTQEVSSGNGIVVTTGAAWVATIAYAGLYTVTARVMLDTGGAWATGEEASLLLYVNGAYHTLLSIGTNFAAGTTYIFAGGSALVSLAAGDTLNIRASQASGAAVALFAGAVQNNVSIYQVR